MLLTVILWIVFGGLAGLIAAWIAGEGARVNGFMNVIVGIIGALIGGFIFQALGASGITGFDFYSLFIAVIGAIILLWIVRLARQT